jgi:hypothetical protein
MFPNVRLMIAAMLASIVVLVCGFGMFAAFQVSHEPLGRLPSASAPQQLSADATTMAYATPEPFDRRFQIGEARNAAEAVEALARSIDRRARIQSAPPSAEPNAAEIATTGTVEAAKDTTPSPAAQSSEKESEKIAAPAADDHAAATAAPDNAAPEAAAPPPAPIAPAPMVATIALPAEPSPLAEPLKPESEATPASVAKAPVDERQVDTPATKQPRHAAKTHRRRKITSAVAQSQTLPDPTFQQAPQRTTRVRHAKMAARKPEQPGSAIGGPLVGAPAQ